MSRRISYPGVALPCPACERIISEHIIPGYSTVDGVNYVESGCPFCGTLFVIAASISPLPGTRRNKSLYNAHGENVTEFSMRNHGVETRLPRDFYEADRVEMMDLLAALVNMSEPLETLRTRAHEFIRRLKKRALLTTQQ